MLKDACVRYKNAILIAVIVCVGMILYNDDAPRNKETKTFRFALLSMLLTFTVVLSAAYGVGAITCSLSGVIDAAAAIAKPTEV